MFEDEDWSIGEDDLKDFNGDEIFIENDGKSQDKFAAKSVATEKSSVLPSTSKLKCNIPENVHKVSSQCNDSVSQRNVILDIFKNNCDSKVLKVHEPSASTQENKESLESTLNVTSKCKKNLVLHVFQETVTGPKPTVKSVLKITDAHVNTENTSKRKKCVAFLDAVGETNVTKKVCSEKANKSREAIEKNRHGDEENPTSSLHESSTSFLRDADGSKKQKLLDLLKSPIHKTNKVPRVKQTVIRKFPGPAGILPDDISESDVIDIDYLDENKNNKNNKYADVCSQNTKNLFTTGAWQLMMDDLPADFELYDIAAIKENALQYSKTYKKVPYLAGIVQYIDYKPNDPHIILKDLSGKVDARIHHSICKLYPNALGISTVILAKDVGIIVTSKKFVCIIISLNNLVSIYSDDVRLVETPHLKSLIENDNQQNHSLHESEISILDEAECHDDSEKCNIEFQKSKDQVHSGSKLKDICNKRKIQEVDSENDLVSQTNKKASDEHEESSMNTQQETVNNDCESHDFDLDEDDSWLGINIDELNSFKPHQFPSSTPMDTNETTSNDTLTGFQIKKSTTAMSKASSILSQSVGNIVDKKQLNSTNSNHRTISEKLLPFRNINNITKPLTSPHQTTSVENIPPNKNTKSLLSQGDDTDDEMLSQLDVDAIAASYSSQNC